ncbi:hypothetical protein [Achromobacter aloeverae]|uniref:DUF669 domain-containing protein n=1 Tax=Achromobacter aloeverae TaxID=1750518 RepID=A0A4Q1HL06_9BURK|nr:hypothetical protein [Achromobacter aloeverae]RXN87985.1 hypothetical protein C7R54_15525 [Achromobacter aloeverae]
MRNYQYDEDSAKQAGVSSFIDATGKYIGKFVMAEAITSKKGTEGIEFSFESDDGRTANFLQCWTYNADGEPLYGLKMLNAILCCARLKTMTPKEQMVQGKDGQRKATVFPGIIDRRIGLLLQREEYQKDNGDVGYKFNIYAPFHADTELMASELIEGKTEPQALAKALAGLADKPMQTRKRTSQPARQSENPADDVWGE